MIARLAPAFSSGTSSSEWFGFNLRPIRCIPASGFNAKVEPSLRAWGAQWQAEVLHRELYEPPPLIPSGMVSHNEMMLQSARGVPKRLKFGWNNG